MASITIQNFYKLYGKLAGMTGTADTEATEFYEIYGLDVVVIPTNVPVIRFDRDDRMYLTEMDKTNAVLEEIKTFHDVGRPILVGTTSVEKSKELSDELRSRWNIEHEVLNAEQHDRESEIIKGAGGLGAVMIATNMAGRGTDIKLQGISKSDLLNHWKRRELCPRDVKEDMEVDEIIRRIYRHIAPAQLEISKREVEEMDDAQVRCALDLSARPYLVWNMDIPTQKIGQFDTELVREFFTAFATHGGITLHVDQIHGLNSHHIVEAAFKAVARALRMAVETDPRKAGDIPSTKGTL